MRIRIALVMIFVLMFAANVSAQDHKPVRGKVYIPASERGKTTVESIDKKEVVEETSFIDKVKKDGRLNQWVNWWKTCDKSFTTDSLVDAGVSSISGDWNAYNKDETSGPNAGLMVNKGGKNINPVWGRMYYVREANEWIPKFGIKCGVVMYKGDKMRRIVDCGELDGVFQAFWIDDNKLVVSAYRKMTPEMSAECHETEVGQCVGAVLWLVDFKSESVWEYRGPVATYKRCEPNDLLVKLYPKFFIQEDEMVDASGKVVKKK